MTTLHTAQPLRSERGMALIMVLLLLAVVSSLATGLTMNSQVEVAMAANEASYAGARAAAEAGMNRAIAAIVANTTNDLLAGEDGLIDAANPAAGENADNGNINFLFTGAPPFTIGANGEYSYIVEIFDDDDPALYGGALSGDQLANMAENGDPLTNANDRLILRVTGFGPNNTTVRVARVLETVATTLTSTTTTTTITNPALLVNGSLNISGSIDITGTRGNVHANGDMTISGGGWSIAGDATAAGTFTASADNTGGVQGGGRPSVNVPDVNAADYQHLATRILNANGTITIPAGAPACVIANCGWSFSGGTWSLTGNGNNASDAGTYYVNGNATISGNPNAGGTGQNRIPLALSLIATGSIQITGTPTLRPHNALALQFVTNRDLSISGNADFDNVQVEGQSLVREQISIAGNPDLRGQIIVQDFTGCGNACSGIVTSNSITGNMSIIYDGSFGDLITEEEIVGPTTTTWVNNIAGWIEGL